MLTDKKGKTRPLIDELATSDNQTDGSQETKIVDADGNVIDSHANGDGGYHLGVNSVLSGEQNYNRFAFITPTQALTVSPLVRLVGTNFDGTTKDTNFWSETVANDGTATQKGEIELSTSTTADGTAQYDSVRTARFVVGAALKFGGIYSFVTGPTTSNIRRMGAYDDDDGFFFQLSGSTFSVGSRTNATASPVDTLVSSGDFNGSYGATWTPTANTYYKFDIEWTPLGAIFYVNGKILHKWQAGHLTTRLSLPIRFENNNSGGQDEEVIFDCLGTVILREGDLLTAPSSYYHASGLEGGTNLKVGAGAVHSIVFGSAANNAVITLIDATSGATPVLWEYDATGALGVPIEVDFRGMPFNDGLRIIVATGNASFTIIYE